VAGQPSAGGYGSADYQAARAGGVRPDLALEQTGACLVAYLRGAGMIGPPESAD